MASESQMVENDGTKRSGFGRGRYPIQGNNGFCKHGIEMTPIGWHLTVNLDDKGKVRDGCPSKNQEIWEDLVLKWLPLVASDSQIG